jgi:hypothetical protein
LVGECWTISRSEEAFVFLGKRPENPPTYPTRGSWLPVGQVPREARLGISLGLWLREAVLRGRGPKSQRKTKREARPGNRSDGGERADEDGGEGREDPGRSGYLFSTCSPIFGCMAKTPPVPTETLIKRTQERFLQELRHHFKGWLDKAAGDLSKGAYEEELAALKGDPVYNSFGFATPEYVLIRLMGRLSISIGRRLGQIYDKIPRFVTQARFNLAAADVAPKLGGRLELDCCIPLASLIEADQQHVKDVCKKHLNETNIGAGLAIEIRYNFNPNDSSRLRKDCEVAELLQKMGLYSVYLVFSAISPRDEAIARLKRAGWTFIVGTDASTFMDDLIGMNFKRILDSEDVRNEITREMGALMQSIFRSHAVTSTMEAYKEGIPLGEALEEEEDDQPPPAKGQLFPGVDR